MRYSENKFDNAQDQITNSFQAVPLILWSDDFIRFCKPNHKEKDAFYIYAFPCKSSSSNFVSNRFLSWCRELSYLMENFLEEDRLELFLMQTKDFFEKKRNLNDETMSDFIVYLSSVSPLIFKAAQKMVFKMNALFPNQKCLVNELQWDQLMRNDISKNVWSVNFISTSYVSKFIVMIVQIFSSQYPEKPKLIDIDLNRERFIRAGTEQIHEAVKIIEDIRNIIDIQLESNYPKAVAKARKNLVESYKVSDPFEEILENEFMTYYILLQHFNKNPINSIKQFVDKKMIFYSMDT